MNPNVTPLSADQKRQILSAISGEVDLPKVSRKYVMGLAITACAVLLLPLLYMSLIALIIGGLFAFVRNAHGIFAGWGPVAPLLATGISTLLGSMLVLGLLKPMLATAGAVKRPRILRRDAEPLLVAYVDRLCD